MPPKADWLPVGQSGKRPRRNEPESRTGLRILGIAGKTPRTKSRQKKYGPGASPGQDKVWDISRFLLRSDGRGRLHRGFRRLGGAARALRFRWRGIFPVLIVLKGFLQRFDLGVGGVDIR